MIIEHAFVTTLEAGEALDRARRFLDARGFEADAPAAPGESPAGAARLVLRRGRKNPARALSLIELPQVIQLEWDRGRITLVATILPRPFFTLSSRDPTGAIVPENDRRQRAHRALLFAIARALEALLARQADAGETARGWILVEEEIEEEDRRRRLRRRIALSAVLAVLVGFIALLAWFARR